MLEQIKLALDFQAIKLTFRWNEWSALGCTPPDRMNLV